MRGSLKVKQTYDHLKENGDVAALSGGGSNARNPHDFDIKLLQAKRQQAEMKRSVRGSGPDHTVSPRLRPGSHGQSAAPARITRSVGGSGPDHTVSPRWHGQF